jgi:hypothetical protein
MTMNTYEFLSSTSEEIGKDWRKNIKMDLSETGSPQGVDWIHLARDRDRSGIL